MSEDITIDEVNCLFFEIVEGFSTIEVRGKQCYIKHCGIDDINIYSLKKKEYEEKALKSGLMSKQDLLDFLSSEGLWSQKEEDYVNQCKIEINNLNKTLSKIFVERDKIGIKSRLEEVSKSLKEKLKIRNSLIKNTSEDYAEKKSNEYFMFKSLYKDKGFEELFFTEEEFLEIDNKDLSNLYKTYNDSLKRFGDESIQEISLNGHFSNMFSLYSRDLSNFFKRHSLDLSFFQMNLLNYAKLFRNILENREIPKDITSKPKKILEHIEAEDNIGNKKNQMKEKLNKSDGFSYARANKKDLEKMGIEKKYSKDLHQIAKESGGKLNMEDFMRIHKK